ncbi:ser/Thr protein phosphatase family protein [Coniochaeta sp. 2T2.1]|nr:ser/Thr protein phosphatase family protein [Coniochaeta sp. 2T2.1]
MANLSESFFVGSLEEAVLMHRERRPLTIQFPVKTKFLIISDTDGKDFPIPNIPVDVAIHCGNLTEGSTPGEFRRTIGQLERIQVPLKLVIAGNRDYTLDNPCCQEQADDAISARTNDPTVPEQLKKGCVGVGDPLHFIEKSKDIKYLREGAHEFILKNGAKLTVYASSYTPYQGNGGFQFRREDGHKYDIGIADVVITHGPPHGVLDLTASNQRGGCPDLFAAVNEARPRLHCFGHIREGWGAKFVEWRGGRYDENPTHLSNIDYEGTTMIECLASLKPKKDTRMRSEVEGVGGATTAEGEELSYWAKQGYRMTSHGPRDEHTITPGKHTLFVNASIQPLEGDKPQMPWIVEIELPEHNVVDIRTPGRGPI